MTRALFLFIDGVGLGDDDPAVNPLVSAELPTIRALLDGRRPVLGAGLRQPGDRVQGERATLVALDATMGAAGIPQSGTGHAALLTGEDAVAMFGRHCGPWVPTALRSIVARRSLLARARAAGRDVAFANAYPEELLDRARAAAEALRTDGGLARVRHLGPLRAGPPLAAIGAGVFTRHTPALERGDAVASEITNEGWIERLGRASLPVIPPERAGANLAGIAARHDLTLYAHYTTDHVGHRGGYDDAVAALETVDRFLAGVLSELPSDTLLLVVSDHGNIEDVRREHTRNPALGLVTGPGHRAVASSMRDLRDVTPVVLRALGAA